MSRFYINVICYINVFTIWKKVKYIKNEYEIAVKSESFYILLVAFSNKIKDYILSEIKYERVL